jgi:hypothetical protein
MKPSDYLTSRGWAQANADASMWADPLTGLQHPTLEAYVIQMQRDQMRNRERAANA